MMASAQNDWESVEDAAERAEFMCMIQKQLMERMRQHLSEDSERGTPTQHLSSGQRAANSNTGENRGMSGNAVEAITSFDDVVQCRLALHGS